MKFRRLTRTATVALALAVALVGMSTANARVPKGTATIVVMGNYTIYYNSEGVAVGSCWGESCRMAAPATTNQ